MAQNNQDKKAQVQEYFSRTAASYVASFSHRGGDDLKRLIEIGEWQSHQDALDVATGGGHTALAVAPHVAHITVSDLTPQMLEQAQTYLLSQGVTNAQFRVADAEQLPFADASFDRVTCRIAPHHFPNIAQAVQEIARVLKPKGLFLLIDSIAPSDPELDIFLNTVEKRRDGSHGRSCTIEEWHHFFISAGLRVEYEEIFRRTLHYDDWTARSQLPIPEKTSLEQFIVNSDAHTRKYFDVFQRADGHLESISNDYILLKGRKWQV
ncbi:MAG: class I SAM-dependent methyltransferase [Ktedonobacteraceae bacterium]